MPRAFSVPTIDVNLAHFFSLGGCHDRGLATEKKQHHGWADWGGAEAPPKYYFQCQRLVFRGSPCCLKSAESGADTSFVCHTIEGLVHEGRRRRFEGDRTRSTR
jgi:hypothetical protein